MAVATRPAPSEPTATKPAGQARRRMLTFGRAAILSETLAFAVLLGASGSAGWRAVRVIAALIIGAVAFLVERQPRPVRSGLAASVLGILGLTTGAGIGVMHLVKSDLTLTAVAGVAILASGLVLLGMGARRLWRSTPRWGRLGALPVAFVLLEFAIIPLTVAIYGTNLPATPLTKATPADRGLAYENVTFTTTDHARLSAWYLPSGNGAAVVLLHGSGSTRASVLD